MKETRSAAAFPALGIVAVGLFCLGGVLPGFARTASHGAQPANQAQIAHGAYLVKDVAGCSDCHTPRNRRGEPVAGQFLKGSRLFFRPLHPVPGWAAASPDIAGLQGWTTQQAVHFLMTGLNRSGRRAGPPMPQFRMNRADAVAVVAYLKSLK